uniref:Nucleolar protein 4 like n=1 Tax=Ursus americanus TaxID=9643 RepID=A0A452SE33_URSAM
MNFGLQIRAGRVWSVPLLRRVRALRLGCVPAAGWVLPACSPHIREFPLQEGGCRCPLETHNGSGPLVPNDGLLSTGGKAVGFKVSEGGGKRSDCLGTHREPGERGPRSPGLDILLFSNENVTETCACCTSPFFVPDQDETSVSSEDFDMNDSTWMSADPHLASSLSPSQDERMRSPQNLHSQEDDDSSSESGSGNGSSTLNPSTSSSTQGDPAFPEMNGNGAVAPMDFTATSEDQPINLCDKLPPGTALGTPSYPSDGCGTDGLRSRVKYGVKTTPESPPYSSGSYDSIKTEVSGCPEDLTVGRAPTADDDDDDHDDHEDNDKMNDSEGMDPERLKAFNMFVRLFVDENLDRMVPISKQPKEKIQAIIESCSRQFPEFQERARKRIRTYLKSCRRMKKNGMEMVSPAHRPPARRPPFLRSQTHRRELGPRKATRLQRSRDEPIALDKQHSRDSAAVTHSTYSLPASSYSQDPVYVNGGLNYSYRGYGALGSNLQPPASLQTGNHSNGPTDLSMKGGAATASSTPTPTPSSNSTSRTMPAAQLSPTEISAVRQLIAGYRESAAFLLRSADELENLILQQN